MPEPTEGESQDKYVSRFVGSEEAKKSFPDIKQRLAVAYSKYRQKHGIKDKIEKVKKHGKHGSR